MRRQRGSTSFGRPARTASSRLLGAAWTTVPNSPAGLISSTIDHDEEDDGARRLGIEDLGQPFDDAEREAGDDGAEQRIEAADHDDGEDDAEDVGAHHGADLVDRRDHHAGEAGERDAEAVGQRDHARHVDAERLRQRRVLRRRAQRRAEPRALDQEPRAEAHRSVEKTMIQTR